MNNELKIFKNAQFGEVRVQIANNEPMFCLADVCRVLEIKNTTQVSQRLDDDEVAMLDIGLNNGALANFVNESGLYTVILRSDKPQAKQFRKWVTSEVLPSIRKHGAYMTDNVIEEALTNPDFLIQLATNLKEEKLARQQAEQQLEEQKPLIDFANHVSSSSDAIDIGEFAKMVKNENIDIGRNRLFTWLRNNRYLMDNNVPYQRYIDNKYFKVIETEKTTAYGTKLFSKTLITGKGQIVIIEKLRAEFNRVA